MKKFLFLLLTFAVTAVTYAAENGYYVMGSFCDWDLERAVRMEQNENVYTATFDKLEGEIAIVSVAKTEWDYYEYRYGLCSWYDEPIEVDGNCSLLMEYRGEKNVKIKGTLEHVKLTFNRGDLTFSGLSSDMYVPYRDEPKVVEKGLHCYKVYNYNKYYDYQIFYSIDLNENEGLLDFNATLNSQKPYCFVISDYKFDYPPTWDDKQVWDYLMNHSYSVSGSNDSAEFNLKNGETVNFNKTDGQGTIWIIADQGRYKVYIDPEKMTIRYAENEIDDLFICGNVTSRGGYDNDYLAPTERNREVYEKEFKLEKHGDIFTGVFLIKAKEYSYGDIDGLPSFRFFSKLEGWTWENSIGAGEEDFTVVPVNMSSGKNVSDIVIGGLSFWGLTLNGGYLWEDAWVHMELDMKNKKITFEMVDSGVDALETVLDEEVKWYTPQGVRVDNPGHGLYILVKGGKSEKIMR